MELRQDTIESAVSTLEASLQATLQTLALAVHFHASVAALQVEPYSATALRRDTLELDTQQTVFKNTCDAIEARLLRAIAILERDARQPPVAASQDVPGPSGTGILESGDQLVPPAPSLPLDGLDQIAASLNASAALPPPGSSLGAVDSDGVAGTGNAIFGDLQSLQGVFGLGALPATATGPPQLGQPGPDPSASSFAGATLDSSLNAGIGTGTGGVDMTPELASLMAFLSAAPTSAPAVTMAPPVDVFAALAGGDFATNVPSTTTTTNASTIAGPQAPFAGLPMSTDATSASGAGGSAIDLGMLDLTGGDVEINLDDWLQTS